MTVANYILQAHKLYESKDRKKKPINIIEVGAGMGSAAESILYYFRNYETQLYDSMTYTVVELSPQLCTHIEQKLNVENQRMLTEKRIKIVNRDIASYKHDVGSHTYVLFFEVLDNLPHDRIVLSRESGKPHLQTMVDLETNDEELVPVEDKLVRECLDCYLKLPPHLAEQRDPDLSGRIAGMLLKLLSMKPKGDGIVFLPTYLLKVLQQIKVNIPGAHLIMSDFDNLPSEIPGINAPIVSRKG